MSLILWTYSLGFYNSMINAAGGDRYNGVLKTLKENYSNASLRINKFH